MRAGGVGHSNIEGYPVEGCAGKENSFAGTVTSSNQKSCTTKSPDP